MSNPKRRSAGQPTGGRFAPDQKAETITDRGGSVRTVSVYGTVRWRNTAGLLHREDGPAVTHPDGYEAWYRNGRRHREDGPAVTEPDGSESWYWDGEPHREDGPAVTHPDGAQEWWRNDRRHREDGPAITRADGSESWWRDGELHREDGPAVTNADGTQEWWLDGEQVASPADPAVILGATNRVALLDAVAAYRAAADGASNDDELDAAGRLADMVEELLAEPTARGRSHPTAG